MLLSTKFHSPLSVGRLTHRLRLNLHLDDIHSNGSRLTLVTAPAGFGKSTLVSAWLRKQKYPFSWLSLDSGDNDPGQFLGYLVGALQVIDPSMGTSQVNRIQTAEAADSEAVYEDVMKNLVNEITMQPKAFLLVLDDCHVLKNPMVLQLLNFLIEHHPEQLRLILLSREDLPLPISRLRVRRQVIEIRQADLQFTQEEAGDFLREGMGIRHLTNDDILALEQRTEGWIAGLQLAGLSIKADPDPANFIKSFTGNDRYILDYFMDEVFVRQPDEIQKFLLASSLLERFCAPLCDTVVGEMVDHSANLTSNSQVMLEQLEHANLFLIPLDNQRRWYRYHHLFAELLRHALARTAPDKIFTLHLRASQWLEANGFILEAVQHAFQTKDWNYAAELVERHGWNMILHSQVGIVSEWCNTFPEEIIRKRPALCIFHGWALIIAFKQSDFPAANIRIEQAQAALSEVDPSEQINLLPGTQPVNLLAWTTGHITLLRSFILMAVPRQLADPKALYELGKLSYDQLPPEDITGRSVGLLDISYASQARCDAEDADKKFQEAIRIALSGGNYFGTVVAEYHRAHGLFAQGRLRETIAFCQEKRDTYTAYFSDPIRDMPAMALFDQAEGCALLELDELDQAEHLLRSGLEVGQWMPREELPGYLALAHLYFLKGDRNGMEDAWRRLDMRWPDIRYCTQAMRILFDLQSRPDDPTVRKSASDWADSYQPEIGPEILIPGIGPAWFDEADHAVYVAWVKIQLLLRKPKEALMVVRPMLEVAREHRLLHRVIELSLLEAQALYVLDEKDRSWEPLQLALSYAEANGYLRIVDRNPILIQMLKDARKLEIATDYIGHLLDIDQPERIQTHLEAFPPVRFVPIDERLIEPLSSREKEVLALMAEGLTNPEIAAKLFLSPNTLKAHTQNIFGKLNVHNRVQAVNRARELNLL